MRSRIPAKALAAAAVVGGLALSGAAVAPSSAATSAAGTKATTLGSTRVAVAPLVVHKLTKAHITPQAVGKATALPFRGTLALKFPISNITGNGTLISHLGGVKLSREHDRISLSRFRINLNRSIVSGLVNWNRDSRTDLFDIKMSHRPMLGDVRLTFNGTSAKALNSTFGVKAFSAGDNFGFATVMPK